MVMVIYILSLLLSFPLYPASSDIKVYVNGSQISFPDQKPLINSDSRTIVPARFVSQALGADVTWEDEAKKVEIRYQGKIISLWIGEKKAIANSREVHLDTSPSLVQNRTMVPLRFISECLGAKVEWNGSKREVYVTTADYADDAALINSDLLLRTPPPGENIYNVNLTVIVQYRTKTPLEPQLLDLRRLLEKRFGSNDAQELMSYISVKKVSTTRLETKDWKISGKHVRVADSILELSITIWN